MSIQELMKECVKSTLGSNTKNIKAKCMMKKVTDCHQFGGQNKKALTAGGPPGQGIPIGRTPT